MQGWILSNLCTQKVFLTTFDELMSCHVDMYTVETNAQVATSLLPACNNSDLVTTCHNKSISGCVRSHRLRQLFDNKSIASYQQTCCKLIVQTCYQQACCKLFQQVVRSLQMTNCNKTDFNRVVATWWNLQACCNLLTSCNRQVKLTICNTSVAFLAVWYNLATLKM